MQAKNRKKGGNVLQLVFFFVFLRHRLLAPRGKRAVIYMRKTFSNVCRCEL